MDNGPTMHSLHLEIVIVVFEPNVLTKQQAIRTKTVMQ